MLKKSDFFKSNDKYKVTVLVSAYNQKDFINEAVDSILMQKVKFNYQILVADDGSTDGTSEILQQYAKQYDFITVKRPTKNLGYDNDGLLIHYDQVQNSVDTEYVALLDGDDYWTDENKLQEQYDFLEQHKECAVVFDSQYHFTKETPWLLHGLLDSFITDYSTWSQTATTFYRNIINFSLYPPTLRGDGGIHFIFLAYGKMGYRDKITSLYRENPTGAWTSVSQQEQRLQHLELLLVALGFCLQNDINPKYIQKHLYDREKQRVELIELLQQHKQRINKLMQNQATALCINTFKKTINDKGYGVV